MMRNIILCACTIVILSACSPRIVDNIHFYKQPLQPSDEVVVMEKNMAPPFGAQKLGSVKFADSGVTSASNGTYEKALTTLKARARFAGGNIVHITSHRKPGWFSNIHRVEADIYYIDDLSLYKQEVVGITPHPEYSALHFYRTSTGGGALVNYEVYVNDTKVYICKSNSKAHVKIFEPCEVTIWAKTETRSEIKLKVKPGDDFFIECSVGLGAFIGRPVLTLVDSVVAINSFENLMEE